MNKHVKSDHRIDPQTCEICGRVFNNKQNYTMHHNNIHRLLEIPVVCKICGVTHYTYNTMKCHRT